MGALPEFYFCLSLFTSLNGETDMKTITTTLAGLAVSTISVSAFAAQIAGTTGIMGIRVPAANLTDPGQAFNGGANAATGLTDGNLGTVSNTWLSSGDDGLEDNYVGATGITITAGFEVTSIELTMAAFTDGGWFGTPGVTFGAGNPINPANLIAPGVQVSSDGGTTWSAIASTTDYLTVMNGHELGGGPNPNPNPVPNVASTVTFDFAGQTGIDAIRLVGKSGGNGGGDSTGFIAVAEFSVFETAIPEPSSLALLGLGGLLIARRRRA